MILKRECDFSDIMTVLKRCIFTSFIRTGKIVKCKKSCKMLGVLQISYKENMAIFSCTLDFRITNV